MPYNTMFFNNLKMNAHITMPRNTHEMQKNKHARAVNKRAEEKWEPEKEAILTSSAA